MKSNYLWKSAPVFMAFLCMGFGDVVGPMVSLAKESYQLSNFMAQLLPLMGFVLFGILSVPFGILQEKTGKKKLLVAGLFIALAGMLLPVINGMYGPVTSGTTGNGEYYIILAAILLLGAGATILQVSGNPIMRDVSPEGKFSSNLSLGQSIKAVGSSMGFLIPPLVAVPLGLSWTLLFPLYSVLLLIAMIWMMVTPVEEKMAEKKEKRSFGLLSAASKIYIFLMVFGIFVYVGAEVSMSSGVPILVREKYGITSFGLLIAWSLFFLPILIGRFSGALLLRILSPVKFLLISVFVAMAGILMMFTSSMEMAFAGIILVGLGFANIFPLIFSITVDRYPEYTNELSGLMVSAIIGGALIPPVMGFIADATSVQTGFIVPLVCLLFILFITITNLRNQKS
ncbi:MAG: MFS transporter [Syntrophothermus sp.]